MKRDMSLIREILLKIELDEFSGEINGYDKNIVDKHTKLLIEQSLLDRNSVGLNGYFSTSYDLTWKGHELIDNIRQKEIWNTIKSEFKEESVSTIVSIAKEMAEKFAKDKLSKLLNREQ